MKRLVVLLAILAASFGLLAPLVDAELSSDDFLLLWLVGQRVEPANGFDANNIAALADFYTRPAHPRFDLYRPSVIASYGVNLLSTASTEPASYQWTTLLIHLFNGALVFVFIRRIVPDVTLLARGAATAVFLVSPLQIEVAIWNAARSDSLSFLFGMTALLWKLRRPTAQIAPLVFVALALTVKESALVYGAVLAFVHVFGPRYENDVRDLAASRPDDGFVRRALRHLPGTIPVVVLVLAYLAFRHHLFGQPLGGNYAGVPMEQLSASGSLVERYGRALYRIAAPVSTLIDIGSPFCVLLVVVSVVGSFGFIGGVVLGFARGPRNLMTLTALLFVMPFAMNVSVSEVFPELMNTRHLYLPMAALAVFIATWTSRVRRRWAAWTPIICLLVVAVTCSRPQQHAFIDARRQVRGLLDSLWTPLQRLRDEGRPAHGAVVLAYKTFRVVDNAADNDAIMNPSLRRPFLPHDHGLVRVRGPASFIAFLSRPTGSKNQAALFEMHGRTDGADEDGLRCRLIRGAPFGDLELVTPASEVVTLDPTRPESLRLPLRFRPENGENNGDGAGRSYRIGLFTWARRLGEAVVPTKSVAGGASRALEAVLPIDPGTASRINGKTPIGWGVETLDERGVVVARSRLGLIYVAPAER